MIKTKPRLIATSSWSRMVDCSLDGLECDGSGSFDRVRVLELKDTKPYNDDQAFYNKRRKVRDHMYKFAW